MNKISVIVPVYNTEKYLHRCVDSILAQTFTDFELLLIDDGSTDRSGAICDEYALKDSRVRVFHKENGGVSSARNLGLDKTHGVYVTFVDSDDTITTNALLYMSDNYEDMVVGAINFVNSHTEKYVDWDGDIIAYNNMGLFLEKNLNTMILRSPCFKLFRKDIINKYDIRMNENLTFGEDTVFVADYMLHCQNVRIVPNICYNYYDIGGDYVHKYKNNSESIYDFFYEIHKRYNLLNKKYGLTGSRIVYADIYNLLKYSIYEGYGDISRFRDFLLIKDVREELRKRTLNLKILLFFSRNKTCLKGYLYIIKKIRTICLRYQ